MNLLITGATGFVGQNLLLAARALGWIEQIVVSVRDPEKLRAQLRAEGYSPDAIEILRWPEPAPADLSIDAAVHCAGVLFARDREAYFRVNVRESMAVIESLPASTRLVVVSSQSAHGPSGTAPQDRPMTWYGESKLEMERLVRAARPEAVILRPPMILGTRDRATLPLFKLAAGKIRVKPGLQPKCYAWIDVGSLCDGILALLRRPLWSSLSPRLMNAACPVPITDRELVLTAAELVGASGIDLPIPHAVLRVVASVVDAIPGLRRSVPSLTRDRVKEIFADDWTLDGADFAQAGGLSDWPSLRAVLRETRDYYVSIGALPRGKFGLSSGEREQ